MSMGASGEAFTDINITPLTDVFLVLLVIMILIAPLIDKSELKIKPPETVFAKKENARTKSIMIDVSKEGSIAINGKTLANTTPEGIQARLQEVIAGIGVKDVPVSVNADGDCKQKDVVHVMTACSASGITKMRVATIQTSSYK